MRCLQSLSCALAHLPPCSKAQRNSPGDVFVQVQAFKFFHNIVIVLITLKNFPSTCNPISFIIFFFDGVDSPESTYNPWSTNLFFVPLLT